MQLSEISQEILEKLWTVLAEEERDSIDIDELDISKSELNELAGMKLVFCHQVPQGSTTFTCPGCCLYHISIKLCQEPGQVFSLK